jgi:hypothetical protein
MAAEKVKLFILLVLQFVLPACNSDPLLQQQGETEKTIPSDMSLKLQALRTSSHCGPSLTSRWISSQQELDKLLQATQPMLGSSSSQSTPAVNFFQYGVLLVSMGQQRTAGYGIRLIAEQELQIASGTAEVRVQWKQPQPGMMLAQVITHPCIFIQVPRGEYQLIRVIDDGEKVRAEINVK